MSSDISRNILEYEVSAVISTYKRLSTKRSKVFQRFMKP